MTTHRPTILQIIPKLDTGGAERSALEVAEGIVKGGGRALVLAEGGRMVEALRSAGGEWIDFPAASKNPIQMARNARAIAEIAHAQSADLIQAESRAPAWSALYAARKCGVPFITTFHGAYSEKNAVKKFYNSVMVRSDAVIANSQFTADLIKARYGTPADQIRLIHRGIDVRKFDPAAVSRERIAAMRAAWGVRQADRVILLAARLSPIKGHEAVIGAIAGMTDRPDDLAIVFAGDAQGRDAYRNKLQQQIAGHGLQNVIRLAGHVDDMPAAYAASWAAFAGSVVTETFGLVVAEALAMGCPVIGTDLGAPREIILPPSGAAGRIGWLVPPNDMAAYQKALRDVLQLTPSERAAIGARGRAHVCRNFSVPVMQSKTLALYDELLGSNLARTLNAGVT